MDTEGGGEWTNIEIEDLKAAIGDGLSVEAAAEILDRSVDEVRNKCLELGLKPEKGQAI
jgi:hypothetical protein